MANRIIDSIEPNVIEIENVMIDVYFHGIYGDTLPKDEFKRAFKDYLISLGVKNTEDFHVMNCVFPYVISNITYDAKAKKIIPCRRLKNTITQTEFKSFLSKYHANDEFDIQFFMEELFHENKCVEIDLNFARKQVEYGINPYALEKLLTYFSLDMFEFDNEYVYTFEYDLDLAHSHIGVGTRYKTVPKDYAGKVVLDVSGVKPILKMKNDNGFDFIYFYADVVKYNDRC